PRPDPVHRGGQARVDGVPAPAARQGVSHRHPPGPLRSGRARGRGRDDPRRAAHRRPGPLLGSPEVPDPGRELNGAWADARRSAHRAPAGERAFPAAPRASPTQRLAPRFLDLANDLSTPPANSYVLLGVRRRRDDLRGTPRPSSVRTAGADSRRRRVRRSCSEEAPVTRWIAYSVGVALLLGAAAWAAEAALRAVGRPARGGERRRRGARADRRGVRGVARGAG